MSKDPACSGPLYLDLGKLGVELGGSSDIRMRLSQRAKDDVLWWINNVTHSDNPVSMGKPDLTVKTDAGTLG